MSIDIAIIDSGINPSHPHVQRVAGGVAFDLDSNGRVRTSDTYEDRIGHGTAIAGIFKAALPSARLWAVKIFDTQLSASSRLLFAGLDWAIRANINIIHLSLGTEREADRSPLEALCRDAHRRGLVVAAAARSHDDRVYPARFNTVFGVYWNRHCDPGSIVFHPDNPIEFGAWGHPRPLPGLDQRHNLRGSSFAVAHVSARIARLLTTDRSADSTTIKSKLIQTAEVRPLERDPDRSFAPGFSQTGGRPQ